MKKAHTVGGVIKNVEAAQLREAVPAFCASSIVKIYNKIRENNRERIQIFKGTVIKRRNGGAKETFTIRKNSNGIGVEKTRPLHSPNVDNVEAAHKSEVRRAKLNYLKDKVGKAAKIKESVK